MEKRRGKVVFTSYYIRILKSLVQISEEMGRGRILIQFTNIKKVT